MLTSENVNQAQSSKIVLETHIKSLGGSSPLCAITISQMIRWVSQNTTKFYQDIRSQKIDNIFRPKYVVYLLTPYILMKYCCVLTYPPYPPKPLDFYGRKNPQHAFLRRGSKRICPMSQLCGMSNNLVIYVNYGLLAKFQV